MGASSLETDASDSPPLNAPRHLLVRGVNWLGDAVMSTPALQRLRQAFPDTRLSLLTVSKLADLWRHDPVIDDVIAFHPRESPWTVARRLRHRDFDHALVLPNSPRSALEAFLAAIPCRTGFARPWRNWLLTTRVPPRQEARRMHKPSRAGIRRRLAGQPDALARYTWNSHHSLDYLHLALALGADASPLPPRLVVTDEEIERVRAVFGLEPETPWLGLNPGAEYGPAKRWPADRFADVASAVAAVHPVRCVIFGGTGDAAIGAEIAGRLPGALNLTGRTTLRELMAGLKLCRVVLTNDTGPMHVADAVGTPVVVPFGSTSPELTGPGLPEDRRHRLVRTTAPCAPCFLRECPIDSRCLLTIGVERVTSAVLDLWSRPNPTPRI